MQRKNHQPESSSFSSLYQDAFNNVANNFEYHRDLRNLTQTNSTLFGWVKNTLFTQNIFSSLHQDVFNKIASYLPYNKELANLGLSNSRTNELVKKTPAAQYANSVSKKTSYFSMLKELAANHVDNHPYAYLSLASLTTIIAAQEIGVGPSAVIGALGGGMIGLYDVPEYSGQRMKEVSKYCFSAAALFSVFAAQNPALYNAIGIEGLLLTVNWSLGIGTAAGFLVTAYVFNNFNDVGACLFAGASALSNIVGIGSNVIKTTCDISSGNMGMLAAGVSTTVCGLFYNASKISSDAEKQKIKQGLAHEILKKPYDPVLVKARSA